MQFYAYLWLREDGTPYYAGKGKGRRAFRLHECISPPTDRAKILIFLRESELAAFETERELISNWGRLDLGTGCLRNRTNGGDGSSGYRFPPDRSAQVSAFMLGNQYAKGAHHIITPEIVAKRVATRKAKGNYRPKGYRLPATHKQRIAASHIGLKHTAETRAKMSRAAFAREAAKRANSLQLLTEN
jgi:hypothetical protein